VGERILIAGIGGFLGLGSRIVCC